MSESSVLGSARFDRTAPGGTASGPTNRALYDWTYNRAGQVLTEASTISGDASNGTVTYTYDPLARLTGSTLSGTTTTYGWDEATNRTSVQVGAGSAVTTTYDDANRPATGTNPSVTYSSDDDGRLTARAGQTLEWDQLGRLTAVKNAAGTVTLATYTYDPLDRLRTVDYGGGSRTRFRYVGLTTSAAQWLDDVASTVTRHIGTGWSGERLLDWTGAGSNIRIYGENAHHDVTWLATSSGSVDAALRYDPWGNPRPGSAPGGYSPFRFQGSWYDGTTDLSWVVTRWYAPSLGRFVSEDTLLGDPIDPPSRHLYAYGQGEPIGRWDPDGRSWYVVKSSDTWYGLGRKFYGGTGSLYTRIIKGNPGRVTPVNFAVTSLTGAVGKCIWVPFTRVAPPAACTRRDAWNISGTDLWGPFDWIVSFMTNKMIADRDYLNRKYTDFLSRTINLKADFGARVCGGCAWDYKVTTLNPRYGDGRRFWTAVRDDPAPEVLRSDVWGNTYYAYVGRATSISEFELFGAQKTPLGGVSDEVDDEAIRLGFRLWNSYGMGITADRLRSAVLKNMAKFRAAGAGGVKTPLVAVLKS